MPCQVDRTHNHGHGRHPVSCKLSSFCNPVLCFTRTKALGLPYPKSRQFIEHGRAGSWRAVNSKNKENASREALRRNSMSDVTNEGTAGASVSRSGEHSALPQLSNSQAVSFVNGSGLLLQGTLQLANPSLDGQVTEQMLNPSLPHSPLPRHPPPPISPLFSPSLPSFPSSPPPHSLPLSPLLSLSPLPPHLLASPIGCLPRTALSKEQGTSQRERRFGKALPATFVHT